MCVAITDAFIGEARSTLGFSDYLVGFWQLIDSQIIYLNGI